MKKIFVLTGEPSGDKLASKIIAKLKITDPEIEYLCVGGPHLQSLNIKSIYDLKEITYLGFTKVFLNIFKIRSKINKTVEEIIKFKPNILLSVDSPDFTLRVSKQVKKLNPKIKTIHFVAPQVWVWRENRIKKLLFPFEKRFFDKENIQSTFIGHPLLEENHRNKIDISQIIKNDKKIFSIFPGSRISEINILLPILFKFIKLMNKKYKDIYFVFHSTYDYAETIQKLVLNERFENCTTISDEQIKSEVLKSSIFALTKSGTISLEVCKFNIPSVIIYKMNKINFFIIKMLVKVKYANIINIAANQEIIPELLQSKCTPENIFSNVDRLLNDSEALQLQLAKIQSVIKDFKTKDSSKLACSILINNL